MKQLPELSKMTDEEIENMLSTEEDRIMIDHLSNELVCRRQAREEAQKAKEEAQKAKEEAQKAKE